MTAILAGVLALACWLAFAPQGSSGRRLRRALPGEPVGTARVPAAGWPGLGWRGRLAQWRRAGGVADRVPMTVLVQQLAALLKGGRTPARLWEELWLLYGAPQPPNHPEGAAGRRKRAAPADTLGPTSLAILAAARAAALRGAPVAAAIRTAAANDAGSAARPGRQPRELAVWVELAACFDVAEASGCPLAEVLTRFAAHLEAEDDAEAVRQTALAGPKATVRILTWLPFLGLGLAVLLGVDPAAILLATPFGVAALIAGLALTGAGRIWSACLVRAAARPQW